MRKVLATLASFAVTATLATSVAQADTTTYVETNHGWVAYHSEARLYSPITGHLLLGQKAQLVEKANSYWYEIMVNGKDVYITTNRNYTHTVTVTDPAPVTTTPTTEPTTPPTPVVSPTPAPVIQPVEPAWQVEADKVIATAKTQLGAPYYWGHQVPIGSVPAGQPYGFDCSNFVAWSYNTALGIKFSGSSVWQFNNLGTPVPLDQIREGDVLFFATGSNPTGSGHVGIYEGNGIVIQCGGGWKAVTEEPLATTWLGKNLVAARRVIN